MEKHITKKLMLAPHTLKHYESGLNTYFFYNVCNGTFWKTDKVTGLVIATLDGTLSCEGIVNVLHKNNPDIPISELQKHFYETVKFLLKEGYICEHI